jgi:hypothetical protein
MPHESVVTVDRHRRYGSLDSTIMANHAFSCNDSDACTTVASNIQHPPPSSSSPPSRSETSNTWNLSLGKFFPRYFQRNPQKVQILNDADDGIEVESQRVTPLKRFHPNPRKHHHHDVSDDCDLVTVQSMPKTPSMTEVSPSSWSSSSTLSKPKVGHKQEMTKDWDLVSVQSLPKRTTPSNTGTYYSSRPFTFSDMDTSDDVDLVSVKSMPKVRPSPSLYSSSHPKGSSSTTPFRRVSSDFDLVTVKSMPKPPSHSSSMKSSSSSSSSMAPSHTSRSSTLRTRRILSNPKPPTLDMDVDAFHSSLGIGIVSVTSYTRPSS